MTRITAAPKSPFPFVSRNPWVRLLFALLTAVVLLLTCGCQEATEAEEVQRPADPRNAVYVIEGTPVMLIDGAADEPAAARSASRVVTRIWGEPVLADLNEDGVEDAVLILTRSTGGSGTFYYLVAAIGRADGYSGTTAVLLGDRIEPKAIEVRDGKASVRFMTRGADESFADSPTIERTRDFMYDDGMQGGGLAQLVEVAHDFDDEDEGEADPNRMTLEMHTWTWVKTAYNNDTVVQPNEKEAFTLTFADGRVQGTTDCNGFGGAYTANERKIQFDDKMVMTKMYCEGSQETEFVKMLLNVGSYLFTGKGELILEIKFDSGIMRFR